MPAYLLCICNSRQSHSKLSFGESLFFHSVWKTVSYYCFHCLHYLMVWTLEENLIKPNLNTHRIKTDPDPKNFSIFRRITFLIKCKMKKRYNNQLWPKFFNQKAWNPELKYRYSLIKKKKNLSKDVRNRNSYWRPHKLSDLKIHKCKQAPSQGYRQKLRLCS